MSQLEKSRKRTAFTLVEIVIVVLIIGIIAAIAVAKLVDVSSQANDSTVQHSLRVIRNAITQYQIQNNGALPGQTDDLPTDLAPYLHNPEFPSSMVGAKGNAISYTAATNITADVGPKTAWKYSKTSGEFICNYGATAKSLPAMTYDAL